MHYEWDKIKNYSKEEFKNWWDPDKFDYGWINYLIRYCHQYFDIWFNPNIDYPLYVLVKYCPDKIKIWFKPLEIEWTPYMENIFIRSKCLTKKEINKYKIMKNLV